MVPSRSWLTDISFGSAHMIRMTTDSRPLWKRRRQRKCPRQLVEMSVGRHPRRRPCRERLGLAIADGYDRLADLIDNRNRQGQSPAPKVPSTLKGAATLPSRAPPASGSAIAVALGSTGAGRKARPSIRAKNGSCRGGSIPHPATKRRASTSQKTTTAGDRFTCLSGQTPTSVGLAPPSRRDKSGTGFARRFVTLNASTTCRQLYYRFVMRPTMTAAYWLRRAGRHPV